MTTYTLVARKFVPVMLATERSKPVKEKSKNGTVNK